MSHFTDYVINRHHHDEPVEGSVYIGRGTQFGNTFLTHPASGRDLSREESIAWYELWLARENGLLREVKKLKGKTLVCSCSPKLCHGHVLAFVANAERETQLRWYHYIRSLSEPRQLSGTNDWDRFLPKEEKPFSIELDGKYTYLRYATGGQEALRYGEKWRDLVGDGFVLAMSHKIEELEERIATIARVSGYSEDLTRKLEITLEQHIHDLALNNQAWVRGE